MYMHVSLAESIFHITVYNACMETHKLVKQVYYKCMVVSGAHVHILLPLLCWVYSTIQSYSRIKSLIYIALA